MTSIRRLLTDRESGEVLFLAQSAQPRLTAGEVAQGRGFWTLTVREIKRFLRIWGQTILAPLVMTVLFYLVFATALGGAHRTAGEVPFLPFLVPGIVMMSMAQAAFMGPSISLILSKLQGNFVDVLMAPLSPTTLTVGYAVSGVVRGLLVGGLGLGLLWLFEPLALSHPLLALYHAVMGSLMLSLLGLITGIVGRDFDHLGAVQSFIVTPATFLSGSFFAAASLPGKWSLLCFANPFFYMIDGFRYGLIGHAEGAVAGGMALIFFVDLVLFNIAYWLFAQGTGLRN